MLICGRQTSSMLELRLRTIHVSWRPRDDWSERAWKGKPLSVALHQLQQCNRKSSYFLSALTSVISRSTSRDDCDERLEMIGRSSSRDDLGTTELKWARSKDTFILHCCICSNAKEKCIPLRAHFSRPYGTAVTAEMEKKIVLLFKRAHLVVSWSTVNLFQASPPEISGARVALVPTGRTYESDKNAIGTSRGYESDTSATNLRGRPETSLLVISGRPSERRALLLGRDCNQF